MIILRMNLSFRRLTDSQYSIRAATINYRKLNEPSDENQRDFFVLLFAERDNCAPVSGHDLVVDEWKLPA
jgi:hypothetical protein